jgi:uncharacterized protein YebE (UPF0316 family)
MWTWLILPLFIFLARVADVTLQTLRIIFISRGLKYLAPLVGFFEVLIWLLAIQQIMINLHNPFYMLAYAAGFATGNFVGLTIERRLALGTVVVRLITTKEARRLREALNSRRFGVTTIQGSGAKGPVQILYIVVRREDMPELIPLIMKYHPRAFYTIEDVARVSEGIFPKKKKVFWLKDFLKRSFSRKGK